MFFFSKLFRFFLFFFPLFHNFFPLNMGVLKFHFSCIVLYIFKYLYSPFSISYYLVEWYFVEFKHFSSFLFKRIKMKNRNLFFFILSLRTWGNVNLLHLFIFLLSVSIWFFSMIYSCIQAFSSHLLFFLNNNNKNKKNAKSHFVIIHSIFFIFIFLSGSFFSSDTLFVFWRREKWIEPWTNIIFTAP